MDILTLFAVLAFLGVLIYGAYIVLILIGAILNSIYETFIKK